VATIEDSRFTAASGAECFLSKHEAFCSSAKKRESECSGHKELCITYLVLFVPEVKKTRIVKISYLIRISKKVQGQMNKKSDSNHKK
jgi:hypothetical protein